MNFSRSRQPAGLILLVVLSMLAFLGVLVIAYVSFSSKSQRTSFSLASREFRAPPVDDLFEEALMKLVRGTNDPTDPFYGEDLLTDLYGRKDGYTLNLASGRTPVHINGAFVQVPVDFGGLGTPRPIWTQFDDAFTGRIVTVRGGGPLENQSFRVLRSSGLRQPGTDFVIRDSFFIELDPELIVSLNDGTTVDIARVLDGGPNRPGGLGPVTVVGELFQDRNGDPAVLHVNPAPQNAPGIGLEPTGRLTASRNVAGVNVDLPASFFPNVSDGTKGTLGGDYDEAYDAPDYFNWFLAGRVRVPSAGGLFQDRIIPSFHRPSVLNYLINMKDWSNSPTNAEVRGVAQAVSQMTFRPLPFASQHPGFSGGSADFALSMPFQLPPANNAPADDLLIARLDRFFDALIRGAGYPPGDPRNGNPWDVDNDGDGVPDSIWVDIGLPLITSPEGKLLRPLIAPMIEDTGGKLNLNAHGNYAQTRPDYRNNPTQAWAGTPQGQQRRVFRGLGFGPAEIALPSDGVTGTINPAGSAISNTNSELLSLLRERSRWGSRPEPAVANGNPVPGTAENDTLDAIRTADRRSIHTAVGGVGFSSDPFGRGGVGVGRTGQLLASVSGTELQTEDLPNGVRTIDESINDPYEFDPTGELNGDTAFMLDELEAVLRGNSWDNDLLPTRLRNLLRNSLNDKAELARMLTTLSTSFDHPNAVPHVGAEGRQDYYTSNGLGPAQLAQVLFARLRLPTTGPVATLNENFKELIAPELRQSRKLDVNRPFGNGRDDNLNGVVDEPGEPEISAFRVSPESDTSVPAQFQVAPDYTMGTGVDPRQLLARHLYVLMMALVAEIDQTEEDRYPFPMLPLPDTPEVPVSTTSIFVPEALGPGQDDEYRQEYTARRVAQWAVNVVDYRDQDSIMTRFAYDANPLDGWDVDLANPDPRYVVWGVETPELVLSESIAFHDVRVRDTDRDNVSQKTTDDPTEPDPNTDQVRIPQGSLFLELYCPRSPVRRDDTNVRDQASKFGFPREFYRYPNEGNSVALADDPDPDADRPDLLALDLSLTAPGNAPVWRIALSAPHPGRAFPDELFPDGFDAVRTTNPWDLRRGLPNTASFDPTSPDEILPPVGNSPPPVALDRFIVFGNQASAQNAATAVPEMEPHRVFFTPTTFDANGSLRVSPGQFLAIAPRQRTHLGSRFFAEATPPERPSHQEFRVELIGNNPSAGTVTHYHTTALGVRLTPTVGTAHPANFAPAKPLVVGTLPPQGPGWNPAASIFEFGSVGLNISEPLPRDPNGGYYVPPTVRYGGAMNAQYPLQDAYVNMDPDETSNTALDQPLDTQNIRLPRIPVGDNAFEPYLGLIPEYCTAYLQRLANPLVAYHPVTNPYRTVDALPIDLNVFSGEERGSVINDEAQYARRSRQRNGQKFDPGDPLNPAQMFARDVLFSYETNDPENETTQVADTSNSYFAFPRDESLYSSLSFLNTNYIAAGNRPTNRDFDGFSNSVGMDANATGVEGFERNQPKRPDPPEGSRGAFSLHPWLNRPFASHFELMMVPATSAGRLFEEFTPLNTSMTSRYHPRKSRRTTSLSEDPEFPVGGEERDTDTDPPPPYEPFPGFPSGNARHLEDVSAFHGPHRHLLNFFQGTELEFDSAQFSRIFDYVTTLPRFRGEVELVNPQRLTMQTGNTAVGFGSRFFGSMFQPPFNFLHDGRRQGQINLNTLSDLPVWIGLMHGHLNADELNRTDPLEFAERTAFLNFQRSRRGYPVTTPPPPPAPSQRRIFDTGNVRARGGQWYNYAPEMLDGRFPTQYAGMFRNIADADLAPVLPVIDGQPPKLGRAGVVNSLLRQNVDKDAPWDSDLPESPFFVREGQSETHRDINRNPFAHYQTLMRMPNLVTNNSQVFIVRVTMGFFEVDPNNTDSLGREYKEEIAENERYQMLYIIDRSKPVGFIPGEDLNARDVVVYERRLQ